MEDLSVKKDQLSTEPNRNWEISFRYDNTSFSVSQNLNNTFVTFTIKDGETGMAEGEILGNYIVGDKNRAAVLQSEEARNFSIIDPEGDEPRPGPNHIKYIVAESIIQMVTQGKIDK